MRLRPKAKLPHPANRLIHGGLRWLKQADARTGEKILNPVQCFGHGKRGRKPALVGDHVEKFSGHQRREHQFLALQCLRLNRCKRPRIDRVVGDGKLDKENGNEERKPAFILTFSPRRRKPLFPRLADRYASTLHWLGAQTAHPFGISAARQRYQAAVVA